MGTVSRTGIPSSPSLRIQTDQFEGCSVVSRAHHPAFSLDPKPPTRAVLGGCSSGHKRLLLGPCSAKAVCGLQILPCSRMFCHVFFGPRFSETLGRRLFEYWRGSVSNVALPPSQPPHGALHRRVAQGPVRWGNASLCFVSILLLFFIHITQLDVMIIFNS